MHAPIWCRGRVVVVCFCAAIAVPTYCNFIPKYETRCAYHLREICVASCSALVDSMTNQMFEVGLAHFMLCIVEANQNCRARRCK